MDSECAINVNKQWIYMLQSIVSDGCRVVTRGRGVLELINFNATFSMKHPILMHPMRKLSYQFMAAEAHWILTGSNKLDALTPYAPSYSKYSDDGVTLAGAYGPKVVKQLPYVIKLLQDDSTTRQAVMTIWERNPEPSKDIPCTISLQFLVRAGCLHTIVTMRSSDIWLGLPYDLFSFSMVSLYVMLSLKVDPGFIHFNLGSSHLYESNLDRAIEILDNPGNNEDYQAINLSNLVTPDDLGMILGMHKDTPKGALSLI